jgi:hypothetical protein
MPRTPETAAVTKAASTTKAPASRLTAALRELSP